MTNDPFYNQIVTALSKGTLDPNVFEQCVADLLRAEFPTLVPVHGGQDDGMDGAIADGKGPPFPLITTVSKNVIGNLTRNLLTYKKRGDGRDIAVLATSNLLSRLRQKNNLKRARELGFTLIQQYDALALAHRLYRSPHWCKTLLNLTGAPSALSVRPISMRVQLTATSIGRSEELNWIRSTQGDRLLVGHPGSGKTFLFSTITQLGDALFVVRDDIDLIAADIREMKPSALIVDDAHFNLRLVQRLQHLREEIEFKYDIIASCWPNHQNHLSSTMKISARQIRFLSLLSRDCIAQIIKYFGPSWDDALVYELVNQAEGRPGLAATLAHVCLIGDFEKAYYGEALTTAILGEFQPIIGAAASSIMAAFSVGGSSGMPIKSVAEGLKISELSVRNAVVELAAGGIITECANLNLAVRPSALREILIKDVFFAGASSLTIDPFIELSTSSECTALTIIGARARGASIPSDMIIQVLEAADSNKAWKAFGSFNYEAANDLLRRFPDKFIEYAHPILANAPRSIIPLLIKASIGDDRALHSAPSHPMRLIEKWIKDAVPLGGQVVKRRAELLSSIEEFVSTGGDSEATLSTLRYVLHPYFEDHRADPGSGLTITFRSGSVTLEELKEITSLWPRVFTIIRTRPFESWKPITGLLHDWAYPDRAPESHLPSMSHFAGEMLRDLQSTAVGKPGVSQWATSIAIRIGADINFQIDSDYDTLFPIPDYETWEISVKRNAEASGALAIRWSTKTPQWIARRLAYHIAENKRVSENLDLSQALILCNHLTELLSTSCEIIDAFMTYCPYPELLVPFLKKAASRCEPQWKELIRKCLNHDYNKRAAIMIILTLPVPDADLEDEAFVRLDDCSMLVESVCIRGLVSNNIARRLLKHSNKIATAAAWSLWRENDTPDVSPELAEEWKSAIMQIDSESHYLIPRVFKNHPEFAFPWFMQRRTEKSAILYTAEVISKCISAMSSDEQGCCISELGNSYFDSSIAKMLITVNKALYRRLLKNEFLKHLHLSPLEGVPDKDWIERATMALDEGYSASDIAKIVFPVFHSWTGGESTYWKQWENAVSALSDGHDPRVTATLQIILADVRRRIEECKAVEHRESVYGV